MKKLFVIAVCFLAVACKKSNNNSAPLSYTASGYLSTIAGNDTSNYRGSGPATSIHFPGYHGMAADKDGNVYVADPAYLLVYKIDTRGAASIIAGNGSGNPLITGPAIDVALSQPFGLTVDVGNNLYVSSRDKINKIDPAGIISLYAGTSVAGYSGDGGTATMAFMHMPTKMTTGGNGSLYFIDMGNYCIRKIDADGIINTVVSYHSTGVFDGDGGPATNATLGFPAGIAADKAGNLYISDGDSKRIRKIDTAGIINTIAGNGTLINSGSTIATATGMNPSDLAIDAENNVYVIDGANPAIRKITPVSTISTIAGTGILRKQNDGYGDGNPATTVRLGVLALISVDGAGNVYFSDGGLIRKINK